MKIYTLILAFVALFICSSCETIVDIDLKSAESQIVIDASISEGAQCEVKITRSQSFANNNSYKSIEDATVILSDEEGNEEILTKSFYRKNAYISEMRGVTNMKYYLKVIIEDKTYEAGATIPDAVPIDNIYIYDVKVGNKSWYSPSITYKDPPGEANYYYAIVHVNERKMDSFYLFDDEFRDGKDVHKILFFNRDDNNDKDLQTGDQVDVEMQTLDIGMYKFYKTWTSFANGGAANPATNISGGALGCFKAYNSSTMTMIVSSAYIYSEE